MGSCAEPFSFSEEVEAALLIGVTNSLELDGFSRLRLVWVTCSRAVRGRRHHGRVSHVGRSGGILGLFLMPTGRNGFRDARAGEAKVPQGVVVCFTGLTLALKVCGVCVCMCGACGISSQSVLSRCFLQTARTNRKTRDSPVWNFAPIQYHNVKL